MENLCIATSPQAFVRQIMASYLPNRYHYYVTGHVPERYRNNPQHIDHVLSQKYRTSISKSTRSGLVSRGYASIRYLRFGSFWILVGTDGLNCLKSTHRYVHHFRDRPLYFYGYSILLVGQKPTAHIERHEYLMIKRDLLSACIHPRYRNPEYMAARIRSQFSFEPYAGVLQQFGRLMRAINRRRGSRRLEKISLSAVTLHNSSVGKPRLIQSANLDADLAT